MTLIEAWTNWMNLVDMRTHGLWGISIPWWGRIGKLLQLFSAFTIVIELLGRQRIAAFLDGLVSEKATARILDVFTWGAVAAIFYLMLHVFSTNEWAKSLPKSFIGLGTWFTFLFATPFLILAFAFISALASTVPDIVRSSIAGKFGRLAMFVVFLVGFHFDLLAS